jgi:hypothetical protein
MGKGIHPYIVLDVYDDKPDRPGQQKLKCFSAEEKAEIQFEGRFEKETAYQEEERHVEKIDKGKHGILSTMEPVQAVIKLLDCMPPKDAENRKSF